VEDNVINIVRTIMGRGGLGTDEGKKSVADH